jgi:serine phosphatase RsbU (regulator of sigma subunit)/DNA-binding transcriptional regulator YhcF (GntR family)
MSMVSPHEEHFGISPSKSDGSISNYPKPKTLGLSHLARDLFAGRFRTGQSLDLRAISKEYQVDFNLIKKTFAEFELLGMVTITDGFSAVVHSPNPKEMQEAYELRAAIEEIAGRAAAENLNGDTSSLQIELDAMRAALKLGNLDAYAEHAANFHRIIVVASENDVLLRVWNILAFELRIRAFVGKLSKDLPELAETHQPIVDALQQGRAREAGILLRNQILTFLESFRKAEWDSSAYRAIRRDLEGAKHVQESFFPPRNISIPCVGTETFYQPAQGLGGDYYDFLQLPAGRWGIAIGDVSGKGISAALIMAGLHATLRAQAFQPHSDPSILIGQVNRLVYDSSPPDFFASLFYAEYEPATRILEYVNAGHHPPIVIRSRNGQAQAFYLKSTDVPLGISQRSKFPTAAFQLHIDDLLVAYTDGITEVENRDREMYGLERLERLLRSSSGATAEQIIERILDEISAYADGQPQRDDITLVVMRVQPGCEN